MAQPYTGYTKAIPIYQLGGIVMNNQNKTENKKNNQNNTQNKKNETTNQGGNNYSNKENNNNCR